MLEKLSILKDNPLLADGSEFKAALDAFNHQAYADALFKIIQENLPPLSIGLFGPWGIGKSTVINILFDAMRRSADAKLKPIYFNAWKYSDDSFRRQFLIEVAKQVYKDRTDAAAKVHRLEQLNYTEVIREEEESTFLDRLKRIVASIRVKKQGVPRLALVVITIAGAALAYHFRSVDPFVYSLLVALLVSLLGKPEEIFQLQKPPVYDPQLIFPEQFQREFEILMSPDGPLGPEKAVIAIDDIDRCEPHTIRDILISIKTFLGEQNCFFIVPCDDKAIVEVFADPKQQEGYKHEMLRKYFNLGVRMAPLMATDLVDFANTMSRKTGIPASVVQMAVLANCHDARKMKHFLNSFMAKYAVAKCRSEKGLLPISVDDHLDAFAKVVLLEDLYPGLFERMTERPEIYVILEKAASGISVDAELKKLGMTEWETNFPNLAEILRRTSDIKIEHIELFLSLKTTNPESRVPRGFELKNAILKGDGDVVAEIANKVSDDVGRTNLADLLIDLLRRSSDTFLRNTIAATFNLYHHEALILDRDRPRVAYSVSYALCKRDAQKALVHPARHVLDCAQKAGGAYLKESLDKYLQELSACDSLPANLVETLEAVYEYASDRSAFATLLNQKLEGWITREDALKALLDLDLPAELKAEEMIPSAGLLEKIGTAIEPDAGDVAMRMNTTRRDVVFKYWKEGFADVLGEQLHAILQQSAPSETAESERAAFVIDTFLQKPELAKTEVGPKMWPLVQQIHDRTKERQHKLAAHKVLVEFAARSGDAGARTTVRDIWKKFTPEQLKDVLGYIATLDEPARAELAGTLLDQEMALARNEVEAPTDRTMGRVALCYENGILDRKEVMKAFLLEMLDVADDNAFDIWRPVVTDYASKLGEEFRHDVATKALGLVAGAGSDPRRDGLLELFTALFPGVKKEDQAQLLPRFFDFCRHSDAGIRNKTVAKLRFVREGSEESEYRLGLNTFAREMFAKGIEIVPKFWPVIEHILNDSDLFGDYEWRDLADLSKRLMAQTNDPLKQRGLMLAQRIPTMPKEHGAELVQLLVNTARSTSSVQAQAVETLQKLEPSELDSKAKKILKEYRDSLEEEKNEDGEESQG